MKVTDVQAILLAIPLKDLRSATSTLKARKIVVKVFSDEGIVGIGEAFAMGAPVAVCDVIEQELKPCLLGEDPCLIEKIVEKLFRSTFFYTRRGLGLFAISSVEIALWDLLGWRLLAHRHKSFQISSSILLKVSLATTCW
jgi:L-alanine-DL-glutamate epimerase-like enolase superfamily enzyme